MVFQIIFRSGNGKRSFVPGGVRQNSGGSFGGLGTNSYWWSSNDSGSNAWNHELNNGYTTVNRNNNNAKSHGFSVRCVGNKPGRHVIQIKTVLKHGEMYCLRESPGVTASAGVRVKFGSLPVNIGKFMIRASRPDLLIRLLVEYRDSGGGGCSYLAVYGQWWSSVATDGTNAYYHQLNSGYIQVNRNSNYRSFGFSVRCVGI